jgi:hypothetical protein
MLQMPGQLPSNPVPNHYWLTFYSSTLFNLRSWTVFVKSEIIICRLRQQHICTSGPTAASRQTWTGVPLPTESVAQITQCRMLVLLVNNWNDTVRISYDLISSTMATFAGTHWGNPRTLVRIASSQTKIWSQDRCAPKFFLGGGGADPEAMYTLCLILKIML